MAAPQDSEGDIDLTDNDISVSELGDALDQERSRAPSPDTPEPPSPTGTEEAASPAYNRRNTMSLQGGPNTPALANPGPVPLAQPATVLPGDAQRRPKIKEPDVFRGERSKL